MAPGFHRVVPPAAGPAGCDRHTWELRLACEVTRARRRFWQRIRTATATALSAARTGTTATGRADVVLVVVKAPTGTVTFLFTDIEASTRRWESDPSGMADLLARHDLTVRDAVARHHGHVFATGGDGFAIAFHRAGDALGAAVEVQRALQQADQPPVRMGAHTGEAVERDGDYFGPA